MPSLCNGCAVNIYSIISNSYKTCAKILLDLFTHPPPSCNQTCSILPELAQKSTRGTGCAFSATPRTKFHGKWHRSAFFRIGASEENSLRPSCPWWESSSSSPAWPITACLRPTSPLPWSGIRCCRPRPRPMPWKSCWPPPGTNCSFWPRGPSTPRPCAFSWKPGPSCSTSPTRKSPSSAPTTATSSIFSSRTTPSSSLPATCCR